MWSRFLGTKCLNLHIIPHCLPNSKENQILKQQMVTWNSFFTPPPPNKILVFIGPHQHTNEIFPIAYGLYSLMRAATLQIISSNLSVKISIIDAHILVEVGRYSSDNLIKSPLLSPQLTQNAGKKQQSLTCGSS